MCVPRRAHALMDTRPAPIGRNPPIPLIHPPIYASRRATRAQKAGKTGPCLYKRATVRFLIADFSSPWVKPLLGRSGESQLQHHQRRDQAGNKALVHKQYAGSLGTETPKKCQNLALCVLRGVSKPASTHSRCFSQHASSKHVDISYATHRRGNTLLSAHTWKRSPLSPLCLSLSLSPCH